MRGLASYLLAGILVVLTMNCFASPLGLGFVIRATPSAEPTTTTQFVDRTHKGDRLSLPTSVGEQQTPESPLPVMIGCDPPFSRLLASAHTIASGRCVADIARSLTG
jgi:hypothetical protein